MRGEVYDAVVRWYKGCFPQVITVNPRRVAKQFEEIYAKCEMAKAVRSEFGVSLPEGSYERGFWWDGEWEGREISCFVTSHKALCRVGDAVWKFAVWSTPEGVYIKPDSHLYSQWTRVAARGGE